MIIELISSFPTMISVLLKKSLLTARYPQIHIVRPKDRESSSSQLSHWTRETNWNLEIGQPGSKGLTSQRKEYRAVSLVLCMRFPLKAFFFAVPKLNTLRVKGWEALWKSARWWVSQNLRKDFDSLIYFSFFISLGGWGGRQWETGGGPCMPS